VLVADNNAAAVAETVATIEKAGGLALAAQVDAGAEGDVRGLVERAVGAWGGLDVFYANAGISGGRVPLFEQPIELWQEVLRVNLIGPFLAIKHAGPVMVRQGCGSIVCTASVAGLRANAALDACEWPAQANRTG
jgi:NAD(P)-dependent dehydrogenase (short-subunit alcohol dehydrogenase family)